MLKIDFIRFSKLFFVSFFEYNSETNLSLLNTKLINSVNEFCNKLFCSKVLLLLFSESIFSFNLFMNLIKVIAYSVKLICSKICFIFSSVFIDEDKL